MNGSGSTRTKTSPTSTLDASLGKSPCKQIRSIKSPTSNGDPTLLLAMDGSPGPIRSRRGRKD
eukprot:1599954-Amphidinium_carterae.1